VLIAHQVFVDLFRGDVDLVDDTPTERKCPCCSRKMRSCRIAIDGIDLDHDTLYCPRDGVWLGGGLLEHILYATERESHREFPGPRGKSHVGPGMLDLEREQARIRVISAVRSASYFALLGLGFALSLASVIASGWWCVVFLIVASIALRWWMFRSCCVRRGPAP
jgi:Zn-finger nucleic acid-binding protein